MRRVAVFTIFSFLILAVGILGSATIHPQLYSAGPLGSTDYPWRMFHYDQFRGGATLASAPGSANQMWRFATGSFVYSSPAVSDGLVFVTSYDTNAYAIDEYSGQQKWSFYTGSVIFSSPAVANGMVYFASRNGGILYALNEQTGSEVWGRGYTNYFIASSPAVADGKVFYGSWCAASCFQNGQFVALDASTGAAVWGNATLPSAPVASSPAVDSGRVFFGLDDGSVTALNETTGKAIWRVVPGGVVTVRNAPAIAYGRVYIGTATKFFALDEMTGATDWSFNTGNTNSTSAVVSNDVVYFGTGKGNIYAVNATTGAQKWVAATGAAVSSSPALSLGSNMILAGSNDHYLYALNATSGVRLWRYVTSAPIWSSPAIADGRVFFGSDDYNVYALGLVAPRLQATVFPSTTSLKPGQVSLLTITVTNGSAPQTGVTLALTSSAGGGFTQPVPGSPGLYYSNFTAPLVSVTTSTVIQVVASESGFLSGSAQTTITVNPFPPLTVEASPSPTAITPGGEIVLEIRVTNGTSPVTGATIFLSSSAGGSFTNPTDGGNGNYTAIYSTPLQASSPTVVIQASKPGFSSGQDTVTVTVNGIPNLTNLKVSGIPFIYLIAGIALLFLMVLIMLVARRKSEPKSPYYRPVEAEPPTYASRPHFGEGLSSRFRGGLFTGLAAIDGS
jgi:eukaryotic-like serine/threonine-protein kinase